LARGTIFGCQNWSGWTDFGSKNWSRGPVLAGFSAKIGPARLILGGTDFDVTVLYGKYLNFQNGSKAVLDASRDNKLSYMPYVLSLIQGCKQP